MRLPVPLPRSYYLSEDVVAVAKSLLGQLLCTQIDGVFSSGMIVETEAYRGPDDKASHAYDSRLTTRTKPMFLQGGTAYVYLCYGIHHLFNVVTGPEDMPHAVLIRALEPIEGWDTMLQRRRMQSVQPRLTAGPGTLSAAMGINRHYSGIDLTEESSAIWIEAGAHLSDDRIIASPRVGVGYSEECAAWPWRFRIKDSRWSSPAK